MTETTFNKQFDIVMDQNNFEVIVFKLLSFYSFHYSFPIQNNDIIMIRGSNFKVESLMHYNCG